MEIGLLGSLLMVFVVALLRPIGDQPLWGMVTLVALSSILVGWTPGNLWLVNYIGLSGDLWWVFAVMAPAAALLWGSTLGVAHCAVIMAGPVQFTYELGLFQGGLTLVDYRWTLLLLLGVTSLIYYRSGLTYETVVILLVAVVATLVTFGVDHLVVLYLALELQALCLYTLIGYDRFNQDRIEASLKYLLFGSLISGILLLSLSQYYGVGGSFFLFDLVESHQLGSAYLTGVVLFKLGVWPFYFWSPMVYAPIDWGTLTVVVSLAKVNLWYLLGHQLAPLAPAGLLWWSGMISIGVGAIGGYYQTRVGSLLAYSSVINGGYLLLLVSSGQLWHYHYYVVVYLLTTGLLLLLLSLYGSTQLLTYRWSTRLALGYPLLVYYGGLSLSGLPVYPGVFSKIILVEGLLSEGWLLLVVLILAGIIPAVYYLQLSVTGLFQVVPAALERRLPYQILPVTVAGLVVVGNGFFNFGCSLLLSLF